MTFFKTVERKGTKLQLARLAKVAEHLRTGKLGHTEFNFSAVSDSYLGRRKSNGCGTMGCAMGELPIIFPKEWIFSKAEENCFADQGHRRAMPVLKKHYFHRDTHSDVKTFFGIVTDEANHLFYPCNQRPALYGGKKLETNATPAEVADGIDAFIQRATADAICEML